MDLINLNSFLKFGYFLRKNNDNYKLNHKYYRTEYSHLTETELINLGIKKYKNAIHNQFILSDENLVPLSGGLDSRGILCAILELTDAKNILTYTFGLPGTFDYDIGNYIAKKVGSKHTSYNLHNYVYNIDELLDISQRINYQTILFHHQPVWEMQAKFQGIKIWSGVSIESWFGSHKKQYYSEKNQHLQKQKFICDETYVKSIDLTNINDSEFYTSIDCDWDNRIPLEIQIDILNRQSKYIIPHVLIKGFDYNVLFSDSKLVNFALSLPKKYLINRNLYQKILWSAFPNLFKSPITNNYGLPLYANINKIRMMKVLNRLKSLLPRYTNPHTNYLDFNTAIRERKDLNLIIYESIMDLKLRKIVEWIDIDSIWKRHIDKKANHADALIVLASLEIHLKAGKNL